jgi:AcrR family transcriptional regulator
MDPVEARGPGRPRDPDVDRSVVDAAVDAISELGFDGMTMEAVARRAGVAKATLYRRFPSKVDLALAVCEAASPAMPPTPDTGSVRDDLVEVLGALVEKLRSSDSGRIMPAMVAASSSNPEVREAMHRFSASRRSRALEVLERAVARGEVRDDVDLGLVVDMLSGPVFYRHLISGRPVSAKVLGDLVELVLAGIATAG